MSDEFDPLYAWNANLLYIHRVPIPGAPYMEPDAVPWRRVCGEDVGTGVPFETMVRQSDYIDVSLLSREEWQCEFEDKMAQCMIDMAIAYNAKFARDLRTMADVSMTIPYIHLQNIDGNLIGPGCVPVADATPMDIVGSSYPSPGCDAYEVFVNNGEDLWWEIMEMPHLDLVERGVMRTMDGRFLLHVTRNHWDVKLSLLSDVRVKREGIGQIMNLIVTDLPLTASDS